MQFLEGRTHHRFSNEGYRLMSRHKRVDVRLLNPASGRGYTSRKCAERYVNRGVARWVKDSNGSECLEFLKDGAVAAIVATSVSRQTAYDRAAQSGMAQLNELANLPVIAPGVLLGFGRRKGASRRDFVLAEGF
jgi:hypothetical protein